MDCTRWRIGAVVPGALISTAEIPSSFRFHCDVSGRLGLYLNGKRKAAEAAVVSHLEFEDLTLAE